MDKTIREIFEKRTIDIEYVFWSDHIESYVPKRPGNGHIATAINEQYDAFCDGCEAKVSEWVSVEDESLLPDFDVNVQVWVGEYGIERQASARRTKTNNHGDWGWYESNITNTMLTMVTHHKPTVNPKGPSE